MAVETRLVLVAELTSDFASAADLVALDSPKRVGDHVFVDAKQVAE